jgi:hypothetical protein
MIDAVVTPLLHKIDPVVLDAVNLDEPQLLTTFTVGADGTALTVTAVTAEVAWQPSVLTAVTE